MSVGECSHHANYTVSNLDMINLMAPILAILITFFATPAVIRLAYKWGLVDDPLRRPHPAHTHKGVLPRAGGIALLLGIIIPVFLFLPLNKPLF